MAAVSIKELLRKLEDFMHATTEIDKEAMICDAYVCPRNDKDYPEGTVIFRTINNNATEANISESTHYLAIYPDKLGRLN